MVFYTIAGGMVGFVGTFVVASLFGVERKESPGYFKLGSSFFWVVTAGTVLGAAAGFGYGTSQLVSGHYLPWN